MDEETLFHQALEIPPTERAAFLVEACAGDEALRLRVEALLRAHEESNLLDRAAPNAVPPSSQAATLAPETATVASLATGTKVRYFGDYELADVIARGGMGVVYRARQVSLNRMVALKMILAGQLASEADVQRFHREAEAAARLKHPNIVPIYEIGEYQGQHYFSMKLIDGVSLAQRSADMTADPQANVRLMIKVARAVQDAHKHGILHRDLKPGNILLDADGEPYVADFGLAKPDVSQAPGAEAGIRVEGRTRTGAIVGTPSYMAPEQARAERAVTTAVDVYGLGAILYELLTGRPPFAAASDIDTILQVLEREPTPPRSLNNKVDRDLQTICLKCLEKEPEKRYDTAGALADDLQRWLAGETIQARPGGPARKLFKWAKRNPMLVALLAVLCLWIANIPLHRDWLTNPIIVGWVLFMGLMGVPLFWSHKKNPGSQSAFHVYAFFLLVAICVLILFFWPGDLNPGIQFFNSPRIKLASAITVLYCLLLWRISAARLLPNRTGRLCVALRSPLLFHIFVVGTCMALAVGVYSLGTWLYLSGKSVSNIITELAWTTINDLLYLSVLVVLGSGLDLREKGCVTAFYRTIPWEDISSYSLRPLTARWALLALSVRNRVGVYQLVPARMKDTVEEVLRRHVRQQS